ncbi:Hypothetical protein RMHFA_05695 [Roseomonas mucosa]|nr:Hypothetical protein RMHFA_05695 [Roseomonas mucosa]
MNLCDTHRTFPGTYPRCGTMRSRLGLLSRGRPFPRWRGIPRMGHTSGRGGRLSLRMVQGRPFLLARTWAALMAAATVSGENFFFSFSPRRSRCSGWAIR